MLAIIIANFIHMTNGDFTRTTTAQTESINWNIEDVDALLVLSFGGPEGVDDVRPFLENVTAGRGIPPERLDEVGEHYYHFGGKSPLNDLNREIIANVEKELASRGLEIPVYFGNRNWKPFAAEAAEQMAKDGVKKALVFGTSSWGGYSGCRQYSEDIETMIKHLADNDLPAIDFFKIRQFFDHPDFIKENIDAVEDAFKQFDGVDRDDIRLVFTAHSIPLVADKAAGIDADGPLYSRQVAEASRLVAEGVGVSDYDVVWQSESGNGRIPWLRPDICDHTEELAAKGVKNILCCSIGFISDHMEVVWDLDHELVDVATENGIKVVRSETVGHRPEFAEMVVDLMFESLDPATAKHVGTVPSKGCSLNGAPCEVGCCEPMKRPGK